MLHFYPMCGIFYLPSIDTGARAANLMSPGGRPPAPPGSIGQFPFSNFDGNRYLNNQQQNFVNYVFAQNGSSTYADAGLGAYVQFNPTKRIQFALGLQYPNDASVATLSTPGFGVGKRAWLSYVQWMPSFTDHSSAQYSFTYYESPAVGQQPATRGWSLNAVQELNETWALFGRANAASGYTASLASVKCF